MTTHRVGARMSIPKMSIPKKSIPKMSIPKMSIPIMSTVPKCLFPLCLMYCKMSTILKKIHEFINQKNTIPMELASVHVSV